MESSVVITSEELDAFVTAYRAACTEACAPAPRLERGAWCRFCAARPICPAHTGPLLDLARFEVPTPAAPPSKEAYLQLLADGLDLVDTVKDIGKALHDQAKRALENGDLVSGYALSAGRAARHWRDESAAIAALTDLGLSRDDIIAEAMRSPHQAPNSAPRRAASRFPQNSSFPRAPASRWFALKTRVPRFLTGANSCGLSPRRLMPSKEVGSHEPKPQT